MNRFLFSIIFLLSLFFTPQVYSQVKSSMVTVSWNTGLDGSYMLDEEVNYVDNGKLVVMLDDYFSSKVGLEISDTHFITVDSSERPDSIKLYKDFSYDVNWAKSREGWRPVIILNSLIENRGELKLLSSFTVKFDDNNRPSSLAKVNSSNGYVDNIETNKFNFVDNSVLSSGNWVKVAIPKTGVYKIDYSLFSSIASELGVTVSSVDPSKISVFGQKGGMLHELNSEYDSDDLREFSIEVAGQDDGSFDNGDYILFYAEGPESWSIDLNSGISSHNNDIYSDNTFVFVTIGDIAGKRIEKSNVVETEPDIILDTYNSRAFHESDEVNFMSTGQQWFGERFEHNPNQTFSFKFPNRKTSSNISVKTRVGYRTNTNINFEININGRYAGAISGSSSIYTVNHNISSTTSSKSDIDVSFNLTTGGGTECLLDYVEVNADSFLKADDSQFSFRNVKSVQGNISEYRISDAQKVSTLWNVSNPINPTKIQLKVDNSYSFFREDSKTLQEYALVASDRYFEPKVVSKIDNQNLHALPSVEYVIITHKSLLNSAEKLADIHRQEGMSVAVVDVDKIYEEFSAGRQDLVAIRQFVRMMYQKGTSSEKLKYLLLFGDASFDFKDRVPNNTNLVPSYQSYESLSKSSSFVSDDFFGFMDDHEGENISGTDLIDLAIGRIPVRNEEEGINVINKISDYKSSVSLGDWRNKVQFIADDYTEEWEKNLMIGVEGLADWLEERDPNYNFQKVLLDSYEMERTSGGGIYKQGHIDFMQNVQNGNLVTNFFGHGSEVSWTGNGLFRIDDIEKFDNNHNLPLFITITCEFSRYDNPDLYSGGEKLLGYKDGGAIGLFSTTREISVGAGGEFNKRIFDHLFPESSNDQMTLGEVLMTTKNKYRTGISKRIVSLLGDPALMLAYPKKEIVVNSINYGDASEPDTLKSLMKVHIEGEVKFNGLKDTEFNGIVYPLVFDKKQELESLDNNNIGSTVPYWIRNNVIYKGKSTVKNGEFVMEFVVPKDINYFLGKGKISFYAISDDNKTDATGNDSDVIVGGVDDSSEIDTEGPEASLFMNNKLFTDGGITNSSPIFRADLFDKSGINTVGNGIGHDIKLTLIKDGESQEIILNEFYESAIDDFTRGIASYQFLGLDPGEYTVEFSAWDVFNNSTYSSLNFYVEADDKLSIDDSYNFPNPFSTSTTFKFTHNQPNKELSVTIEIYSIRGELVKTITKRNISDGFVVRDIEWDRTSDSGALLPAGTYIYKLKANSDDGSYSNKVVNKIMIIR